MPSSLALTRLKANPEPLGFALLAAILGFLRLGDKSFWDDEAFSTAAAQLPSSELTELTTTRDPHTALWHLLLRGWIAVGSDSEIWTRSLSVLIGVATAVVLWHVAKSLFDRTTANVATALFICTETFLRFAQEARPGMLTMFLATLVVASSIKAHHSDRAIHWLMWGVVSGLCVYSHPFALAVPAATVLSLLALPVALSTKRLAVASIGFIVAVAPIAVMLAARTGNDNLSWIPPLDMRGLATGAFMLAGGGHYLSGAIVLAFLALFIVLTIQVVRSDGRSENSWKHILIAMWMLVLPVGLAVLSLAMPTFVAKYLSPAFPGAAIALAVSVIWLARRTHFVLPLLLVLIACATSLHHWYLIEDKDDWRSLSRSLAQEVTSDDAVIALGHRAALDYYYQDSRPRPVLPERNWGTNLPATEEDLDAVSADQIGASLSGVTVVWVTKLRADEIPAALEQVLARQFEQQQTIPFGKDLTLVRYSR